MSFWSALVAIVAIIAYANIRMNRDRHGAPPADTGNADPAYTAALEREVAEMRKRLEVLERIATDANSGDAREQALVRARIAGARGFDFLLLCFGQCHGEIRPF